MNCYFPGCSQKGTTKEHIPARSFFPAGKKEQLLTVKSCPLHNNSKSDDDLYVLTHICLNAAPTPDARSIFEKSVKPQLFHAGGAFKAMLAREAVPLEDGAVVYPVDHERFCRYFDALCFGLVFKVAGRPLPAHFQIGHEFHNFVDSNATPLDSFVRKQLGLAYSGNPSKEWDFGQVKTMNATVYSAKLFGAPDFESSITIRHEFYGVFRVTSMLRQPPLHLAKP